MKSKSNLLYGLALIMLIFVQSSYLYAGNSSSDNEISLFLIMTGLLGGLMDLIGLGIVKNCGPTDSVR